MITVRELLRSKPSGVVTTGPRSSVYDALALMQRHDIGGLPVVDNGRLVGVLSERDYARGVVLRGRSSRDMTVAELMSPAVVVGLGQSIHDCMALMTAKRARHLPVLAEGVLVGIVTIGDVVKQIISDQAQTIDELEHYIRGV
ncbi:MAG TPA: CBS domain-containing protein [Planctomycetota bacterium]